MVTTGELLKAGGKDQVQTNKQTESFGGFSNYQKTIAALYTRDMSQVPKMPPFKLLLNGNISILTELHPFLVGIGPQVINILEGSTDPCHLDKQTKRHRQGEARPHFLPTPPASTSSLPHTHSIHINQSFFCAFSQ
jgi:hypothetical protein